MPKLFAQQTKENEHSKERTDENPKSCDVAGPIDTLPVGNTSLNGEPIEFVCPQNAEFLNSDPKEQDSSRDLTEHVASTVDRTLDGKLTFAKEKQGNS